jgi:hypothetical protein
LKLHGFLPTASSKAKLTRAFPVKEGAEAFIERLAHRETLDHGWPRAVGAAEQGFSVALSADGDTAFVGGFLDNNGIGATWVFTRSGGVWSQQGNKLVGTGGGAEPYQGFSVSLSAGGNTAIVDGFADNGGGAAWVFTRSKGSPISPLLANLYMRRFVLGWKMLGRCLDPARQ